MSGPEDSLGPRGLRVRQALAAAFAPAHLEVHDQSHMHSVPRGAESHFKVVVVSPAFAGKALVARHREINAALADELRGGIHALSIEALTPEQWSARGGQVLASPPCLGGSKSDAR